MPNESIDLIVTLTENAARMIKQAADEEKCSHQIRIGIRGGGCSGFQYDINFKDRDPANHSNVGDFEYEQHGVRIYIDPISAMHLEGTTLEYVSGLMGSGFKFINPQATRTCGCGSSFST